MQQQRPRITSSTQIFFKTPPGTPPTGKAPVPPVRKTPAPPPGPAMNPVPATLIRLALGAIGVAFYSVLFLAVAGFASFFYGASIFMSNLDGTMHRSLKLSRGLDKWHNRAWWMWFDGIKAVVIYIFRGGNSRLFMGWIDAMKHPLINISSQYWRDEFRRL